MDSKFSQWGDCSELLSVFLLLCNSKSFIEYLCTCRYYIYAANLSKRSYFTLILSNFLRGNLWLLLSLSDIAFASKTVPTTVDATRFVSYCRKWIPELKSSLDGRSFLHHYMNRLEAELRDINSYRFQIWCGQSIRHLNDSSDSQRSCNHQCACSFQFLLSLIHYPRRATSL